jgi:hypothetical protein
MVRRDPGNRRQTRVIAHYFRTAVATFTIPTDLETS